MVSNIVLVQYIAVIFNIIRNNLLGVTLKGSANRSGSGEYFEKKFNYFTRSQMHDSHVMLGRG